MAVLEIRYHTGEIETRELSKQSPLLVGQHPASDIRIDSSRVAAIHCRISWNKTGWEVTAATPTGVQWNGTTVRNAPLAPGDVIRVLDVEIAMQGKPQEKQPTTGEPFRPQPSHEEGGLRPISDEDLESAQRENARQKKGEEARPFKASLDHRRNLPSHSAPVDSQPNRPVNLSDAEHNLDALAADEAGPDDEEDDSAPHIASRSSSKESGKLPRPEKTPAHPKERPTRPAERDLIRSPLVVGLGAGALLLLLAAVILGLTFGRESAQRKFDAAAAALANKSYPQAIEQFEAFLKAYPRHALTERAQVSLGTALVDQALAGASPAWDRGLAALEAFTRQHQSGGTPQISQADLSQFVAASATRIALGAAESAKQSRQKEALKVAADATRFLESHSQGQQLPAERLDEIAAAVREAESTILRQAAFDAAAKRIDDDLAQNKSLAALADHRKLLDRYPEFADDEPLQAQLSKIVELEKQHGVREEINRDAETAERETLPVGLTLTRRTRTRSDGASTGGAVWALAEESCFGIDSVTGDPLWRRVIGLDTPFTPVHVNVTQPAWLLFDARFQDVLLVDQKTGRLLWRQPLEETPTGSPLVHAGQLYLGTTAGHLYQMDAGTGRIGSRFKFSQPVSSPPALSPSGDRLYVAGHQGVLYVLTRSPLACVQVVYLGHAPGAIRAPVLAMNSLLLVAENDRLKSCLLRVLKTLPPGGTPSEIARHRIEGQVLEPAVLRGQQLFVPSQGERVSAFAVSETNKNKPLSFITMYQVKNPQGGAIYVAAGPDDQMWMASSALRKFELIKDVLRPDKQQLATGLCSQPLQMQGDALFVGRRLPYSRTVFFTRADRQRMAGQWQVALGSRILDWTAPNPADNATTCVTSTGDVYQITTERLAKGGFELQPVTQLPVPDPTQNSLRASRLADGRLAVSCAEPQPQLWLAGNGGAIQLELKLPQPLQADPILWGGRLLLPLPGRLRLVGLSAAEKEKPIEDLLSPIGSREPPRWRKLVPLDETQILAQDEPGRLARIQFRTSPLPHMVEVASRDAVATIDIPVAVNNGRIYLADSRSRLIALDAGSFEPQSEFRLPAPATQAPWCVGEHLFIDAGGEKLICLNAANKLEKLWELELPGVSPAGPPLPLKDNLLILLQDGQLLTVNRMTGGQIGQRLALRQSMTSGPIKMGDQIVACALDGSCILLNPLLNRPPKP